MASLTHRQPHVAAPCRTARAASSLCAVRPCAPCRSLPSALRRDSAPTPADRRPGSEPSSRRLELCQSTSSAQPLATVGDDIEFEEVTVTLKKPMGLVFAQKPSGGAVFVEEVTAGGHADGLVRVGDILAGCSAYMLKEDANTNYSHGQTPYKDFERVDFDCRGQTFQTCMSALKSNNTRWGVLDTTLILHRPKTT